GPPEFRTLSLITPEELHEVRRHWLREKEWFDDRLPRIYEEVTGEPFPHEDDDGGRLRADDWEVLRTVCGDDPVFFDLQVDLLGVERKFRGLSRRSGVLEELKDKLRAAVYGSEQEAVQALTEEKKRRAEVRERGQERTELRQV